MFSFPAIPDARVLHATATSMLDQGRPDYHAVLADIVRTLLLYVTQHMGSWMST